jgi:hypothetical protein
LKRSHDEKKIAEATLEESKKELEKVQKSHEDDLSVIEKLRQKQERAQKSPRTFVSTRPASPSH